MPIESDCPLLGGFCIRHKPSHIIHKSTNTVVITAVLKLGHCDIYFFKCYAQLTFLAQLSGVARQTDAGERNGSIQTGGPVQTGVRLAFIDLCTNRTQSAVIPHHPYLVDCGSVHMCVCVCTSFTVLPSVSRRTHTDVLWPVVVAGSAILTHAGWTRQEIYVDKTVQNRLVTTTLKNR